MDFRRKRSKFKEDATPSHLQRSLRDDQMPERAFISIVQPMSCESPRNCRQPSHILTAHMSSQTYLRGLCGLQIIIHPITSAWMQTSPRNKEAQAFSEHMIVF